MTKKTIFSVNTIVPGDDIQEIDYRSNQTLLDADIILFSPTLRPYYMDSDTWYKGKRRLSENESFNALEQNRHWRSEIISVANAGKLIIVYLDEPDDCFRRTGEKEFSGTGRNRHVTHIVTEISSYDVLPIVSSYETKTGSKIKVTKAGKIIAPYWNEFSDHTSYHSVIEGEFSEVLLESEQGSRVVGAMIRSQEGGAVIFLPPVNFYGDEFIEEYQEGKEYLFLNDGYYSWSEAGLQAGKRFVVALTSLAEAISVDRTRTPPPDWTSTDQYRLTNESQLETKIIQVSEDLSRLEETKNVLQQDLALAGWPRQLLYENSTPLEHAIIQSLKLMGFNADSFDDGESEFDSVFFASEGRFLGEAEGRENKAISIEKLSQLIRNLHEDLARDEVNETAKGVLFGNGYRLKTPEERTELFTKKCLAEAKRLEITLVRTIDMFEPIRYLIEYPEDKHYATACRRAITDTVGDIVEFPKPPRGQPIEEEMNVTDSSLDENNV